MSRTAACTASGETWIGDALRWCEARRRFGKTAVGIGSVAGRRQDRADDVAESALGFLQEPCDPDEDHRADEGHDDRADHAAARPESERVEDPAPHETAEDAEHDVRDNPVTAALHDFAGEPARDEPDDDPRQKSHGCLLDRRARCCAFARRAWLAARS